VIKSQILNIKAHFTNVSSQKVWSESQLGEILSKVAYLPHNTLRTSIMV